MEPITFALLLAILLFFISLLVNLLPRRRSKARFHRLLTKEEFIASFLEEINNHLADLEFKCSIELYAATSPQEVGKVIKASLLLPSIPKKKHRRFSKGSNLCRDHRHFHNCCRFE
jgi:hypothetical protein